MRTHHFPLALAAIVLSAFALGACTGEALESTPVDAAEQDSSEAYPNAQSGAKEAANETPPTAAAPAPARPQPAPRPPACDNCGTIAAIEAVEERGKGTGAGAVGGAAAG
ncbi:MAG: hypothetical protein ACX94A_09820, partial [Algiphilus sp.]